MTALAPRSAGTAARGVGLFFATCAIGNAVGTRRRAREFLEWCRDGAWLPPYPTVLDRLVPVAPAVVVATAAAEAGIAGLLLTRRHQATGLDLATAFVLGISPALAWPYWTANVPQAVFYGWLARRLRRAHLP